MTSIEQVKNAEKFRRILQTSGDNTRQMLLSGKPADTLKALVANGYSVEQSNEILNARQDYFIIENEAIAKQRESSGNDAENQAPKRPTRLTSLAVGPGILYSFLNDPSRYSAEKLEKKADKYAKNEVKTAEKTAKKAKKTFTEDDRTIAYEKGQRDYHEKYVRDYRKRADVLAEDPKNKNKYLLEAIENANNRKEVLEKKGLVAQEKVIEPTTPTPNESLRKDSASFTEKVPSQKITTFGPTPPSTNPIPNPNAPGIHGRTAPKIPGNKKDILSHLPRPSLGKALPNPLQLTKVLSFLNPTNMAIASVFVVILAVFFIVLIFGEGGGGGVGGGGTAQGQPPTTGSPSPPSEAQSNSILYWAKTISDVLELATPCPGPIYNRMQTSFRNNGYTSRKEPGSCDGYGGSYFCTYLVGDSYQLAGINAPTGSTVASLVKNWTGAGFSLVKENNMRNIAPGDAVFWATAQSPRAVSSTYFKHTDIVYAVNINPTTGNGYMQTIDANANIKIVKYNVINWVIQGVWLHGANYPWFGLYR
jgi:hypothetical protein